MGHSRGRLIARRLLSDRGAGIEDRPVEAHKLIGAITLIFEALPRHFSEIRREHAVEEGKADLAVVVAGSVGETVQTRVVLEQR